MKIHKASQDYLEAMLKSEEISKKQYDEWRCQYPQHGSAQMRVLVITQELSDNIAQELK